MNVDEVPLLLRTVEMLFLEEDLEAASFRFTEVHRQDAKGAKTKVVCIGDQTPRLCVSP